MPFPTLIVPILMSLGMAQDAPIVVKAFPWAPFISPMGEPFRPPSSGEAPIARWFVQADRNRDGMLTADEMQADADFNRAVTLAEFRQAAAYRFKLLDSSGQGWLALSELEERLPNRPRGKRAKPRKNEMDNRVGAPLPEGS